MNQPFYSVLEMARSKRKVYRMKNGSQKILRQSHRERYLNKDRQMVVLIFGAGALKMESYLTVQFI